jgi:hypothetical protein
MRKGLALKLAVTCAALGAMTLLQGCEGEEEGSGVGGPWTVAGFPYTLYNYAGVGGTTTSAAGQPGGTASSGGQTVASAVASAAGSGGGQVSAGGVP